MPDSNTDKPRSPDDDESVDLGHLESVDEEASALSFTGTTGSRSGGSSGSGIRSWEQLVRESGGEPGHEQGNQNKRAAGDEAASDKDLLREVLADEPPPSSIILKDPSQSEFVLPPQFRGPKSGPFELPPDLAATRPGDSTVPTPPVTRTRSDDELSILPHDLPTAPGHSGFTSDLWGGSSGIDLFRPDSIPDLSSDSMQRTEEVQGPPMVRPSGGDSSHTLLGEGTPGGDESSAVDLASQAEMSFPFGADSSTGSSVLGRGPVPPPPPKEAPDSGMVDLLTPSREFDVSMPESTTTPSWAAAREDMPPTVPMVPAKARLTAWAGGGALGFLVGAVASFGLWYFYWQPATAPITATRPSDNASATELVAARGEIQKAQEALSQLQTTAKAEADKAATNQKTLTSQLTQARAAANQAAKDKQRADALAEQVKQAEARRAELTASIQQLTNDKSSAEARTRDAEATAARLRNEAEKADQAAKAARTALDKANAAARQTATFTAEIAQRLQAAPGAAATDLLAALDRALARPTGEPVVAAPTRPVAPPTPEQMRQAAHAGYSALRTGDAASAEREFARLAASPDRNAIHFYFLGLAQWRQGEYTEAEESFRRGWALERDSRPPPWEVEAAFERLGRSEREAVNRYRR